MANVIQRINFPEIFLGFVAPIGTDLAPVIGEFEKYFRATGYRSETIKVTSAFSLLKHSVKPEPSLVDSPVHDRYDSHIRYGNYLREFYKDDAILAEFAVSKIMQRRNKLKLETSEAFQGTVFLVHQFKRKEEIDLMRSVYGRLFFQISVYSRREKRIQALCRQFADDCHSGNSLSFRADAEKLVQRDINEIGEEHGQRVSKIFHDADLIINTDIDGTNVYNNQVIRFCDLLFGSNKISPTKSEYGMFVAKAAALRTLDLSRQVGAAIFTEEGEIISMGSNEVPKAQGGTYWCDDVHNNRDYVRKVDSNYKRKKEVLAEIIEILIGKESSRCLCISKDIIDSQFMDVLEYGRIIHAEMSAISDAARLGRSTRGGILYCTTFPCHMCAKHIVGAGISKVIFLEPYPKSLASELHGDSICVEGADRGEFQGWLSVDFEHFWGISPRRYRELFERGTRKDSDGNYVDWIGGIRRPYIDIKMPFYASLETAVVQGTVEAYLGSSQSGVNDED